MLPDRVSNPGPLTYESGALPIALRGPADSQMDGLTEWRAGPNQYVPSTSSKLGGIKTVCGEIFQHSKKCSPCFDSNCYSVQCMFFNQHTVIKKRRYSHFLKDVYSYDYYGHFIFPLRLFRMDMNFTH